MAKILVSKMYSGEYTKNNVGHEAINFVKADNGKSYIYVNPHGALGSGQDYDRFTTVLLVRGIDKQNVEVLANVIVKKQSDVLKKVIEAFGSADFENVQNDYIKSEGIKYGGHLLNEIFPTKDCVLTSYEAESIFVPRNGLFLTTDKSLKNEKNYLYLSDKDNQRINGSASHWFYEEERDGEAFRKTMKVLMDSSKWDLFHPHTIQFEIMTGKFFDEISRLQDEKNNK